MVRNFVFFVIISFSLSSCFLGRKATVAEIETDFGLLEVELYEGTPKHKENFVKLANEEFYNGVLFHRVIKDFMIQTGDPNSKEAKKGERLGNGGPGYTIPAEFDTAYFHKKGALAAARQGDRVNPKKESSGSQFYIVHGKVFKEKELELMERRMKNKFSVKQKQIYTSIGGTPHLDGGYTVFGEVIKGMNVVDSIAKAKTDRADRPIEDIKIKSVKIKTKRLKD